MITILSNPTGSRIVHKSAPNVPTAVNMSLTNNVLSSSVSSYYTGSDGHIYVQGIASGVEQQLVVNFPGATLSTDSPNVVINGNTAYTLTSNQMVTVNTPLAGTYTFNFGNIVQGQSFNYIYCNSSSLKIRCTNELAAHYNASGSLGNYFNNLLNQQNCWTNGINLTGIGIDAGSLYVSLVTPLHGVTANHMNPTVGNKINFYDTGSNLITSSLIAAVTNLTGSDFTFVTFASPLPSTCTPCWVFPPTFFNYVVDVYNTFSEPVLPIFIPNHNYQTIQCMSWNYLTSANYEIITGGGVPNCPFSSTTLFTGGDSSAPCLMLVGGKLVYIYSLHYAQGSGPFISNSTVYNWLSNSIAPYSMSVIDLSSYQSVF